jgi:hypothetical protein
MTDPAHALAFEARRRSLLTVLWQRRHELTLEQLDELMHAGELGRDLGAITLAELLSAPSPLGLAPRAGEPVEAAVLRVFRALPRARLTSGFFVRHMGLRRWTAQKLLADLAERGQLIREGKTSGTRYRLAVGQGSVDASERAEL